MSSEPAAFKPAHFGLLAPAGSGDQAQDSSQAHGYATGYAHGIRAAEAVARTQREDLARAAAQAEASRAAVHAEALRALAGAAAALHARTVPVLDAASTALVESALMLAERIVGSELSNHRLGAKAALDRALHGIEAGTVRQVRMNPQDLELLGLDTVPETDIELVPDPSLARGDALTAFDEGFLDARIATAFERAAAALRGAGS
ncbi:FliH/SctL family protein [Paeniglutamicibacter psychrophenolicus]|uniref:FliH/SctL family protein n=1 Tax=Paeniglutamicibacter psychrophenolicus TaxID=257454 RepID=UPI0027804260|nr:FliH/SctL family protein [Paeniglutamicibacter psychrophenolicus]MDQ0094642.1 flagellar assembly protein FliH [Paeniglutamicibacter psychrophenolicus]